MTGKARANGEGSIFPYRQGFAAYVWVRTPMGERKRKYVYGKTREEVHEKWIKLHQAAKEGSVASRVPRLDEYLQYWLHEVIKPNRDPLTFVTTNCSCGSTSLLLWETGGLTGFRSGTYRSG